MCVASRVVWCGGGRWPPWCGGGCGGAEALCSGCTFFSMSDGKSSTPSGDEERERRERRGGVKGGREKEEREGEEVKEKEGRRGGGEKEEKVSDLSAV